MRVRQMHGKEHLFGGNGMTDQELKKLSRAELLEMLVEQSALCDSLQNKLNQALKALQNRRLVLDQVGSLAEASMKLSGVFEAADRAAQLYLENVQRMDQEVEVLRAQKLARAQQEADRILADAARQSQEICQKADQYYKDTMQRLRSEDEEDSICVTLEAEDQ